MLRNGTWAIMGPRCLMNCELVRSQFIAQILTPVWGPVWDPLVVSMGQFFFPSALRLSVPKNVKGLRNNKFRGTPAREQTAYIPWKDTIYKKSWGDTKKVVDTGAKYPQPESLVLSIFYQQNIEQHVQDCLLGHVGSCSIPRKY